MKEIWKDIKGFEGLYMISNYGRVVNRKGHIIKPFDNKGYLRVKLTKNRKRKSKLVHVLVVENFISEKPFLNAQVNHKDLNKTNNRVDNLEWTTPKENVNHAIEKIEGREKILKESMSAVGSEFYKLGVEASKKSIIQIDLQSGRVVNQFESAREAERQIGANYKNISQVCKGERKSHMGYGWRFVDKKGATTIETTSKDGRE